jgi:hypothetical protein
VAQACVPCEPAVLFCRKRPEAVVRVLLSTAALRTSQPKRRISSTGQGLRAMRIIVVVCLVILASTPGGTSAQTADANEASRWVPSERSPSLVLTPQGAERLAPAARIDNQLPLRSELEAPTWSRSQSLALLWATTIACAAMGTGCTPMPSAPTSITPPGSESWQRVGCKTPETCGWLWTPAIKGPYPSPQQ